LERLEIKVCLLSEALENKDFRIDSQFYTQIPHNNSSLSYKKIGDILVDAQYGISIGMNEHGEGYPIYRMNEIHSMMCDLEVDKFADISDAQLKVFSLNDRDVLFNRTNSFEWVGRTGLYRKHDKRDFVFASYLVRFIPNQNEILPEYLTAFLNSKFGVFSIKRRARQSINQTNVNPEEVKNIEIPILSLDFQNEIKKCFDKAHELTKESERLYCKAEEILNIELGVDDFSPSNEAVNIKTLSESFGSTGRLDAEYYQKKYEDYIRKIKQSQYERLANIVSISKSIEPGSNFYSKTSDGIPFLRVADFDKFSIQPPAIKLTHKYVDDNISDVKLTKPKKNVILLSKDGTVGIAFCLKQDIDVVCSGAILQLVVLDEKLVLPDYLTLILNSKLVQMQAQRDAGGSIILHWRLDEIQNVLIPIIQFDKQIEIAALLNHSFILRGKSEELMAIVKQGVEIAIENNEEMAMKYLLTHIVT
jgi:restriction endonuclease S subunit